MTAYVISGRTALSMLEAPEGPLRVSLDLGLSDCEVQVAHDAVLLPDGSAVAKAELRESFRDPQDCIEIVEGRCAKVYCFDPDLGRYYKLFQPHADRAPTLIIAGQTMHAIVGTDPWEDTTAKVRALECRGGACLDTCFGLGYSARLLAAAGWKPVVSCEIDPNVLRCARANPWSRGAFESKDIEIVEADAVQFVRGCPDGRFAAVFHDPPVVQLAGELYSTDFYRELARILARRGALYHYVGTPGGRYGRDQPRNVMQRLHEAGFTATRRAPRGVIARRP